MGRGKGTITQNMAQNMIPRVLPLFLLPSPRTTKLRSKQCERGLCGGEKYWLQISYGTKSVENYNPEEARMNFLEITPVANNSNWQFSPVDDCSILTFNEASNVFICMIKVFRDVAWEREILSLRVKCNKSDRGCEWIGQLRYYEVQYSFLLVICLTSGLGCSKAG